MHNAASLQAALQCRSFTQMVVLEMLQRFPEQCNLSPQELAFAGAASFLSSNADFRRLCSSTGGPFDEALDVEAACSPRGVFAFQVGCHLAT